MTLAPFVLLVLAAAGLLLTYARPLTYTITVGAADDQPATVGFFDRERNPVGTPYRWTRDRSILVFHAAGLAFPVNRAVALDLPLAASRPPGVGPARVTVQLDGVSTGQQAVGGEARYRYLLERGVGAAVDTRVTLLADTFTPPGDQRVLGVAVLGPTRLVEEAATAGGVALPPGGAWWRWLGLVLAGYGVALACSRRPLVAAGVGAVLVLALTSVAFVARVAFWQLMHLPLLTLALALPVVWRREIGAVTSGMVPAVHRRWGVRAPALALVGLLPAIVAQGLLTAGRAPLLALALYTVGVAVIAVALLAAGLPDEARAWRALAERDRNRQPDLMTTRAGQRGTRVATPRAAVPWGVLAGIVLLAAGARLYRLTDIPFGLWRDEARHGLEALRILDDPGYRPVYVPNISLPGLYPAIIALAFKVFGAGTSTLRGVTAVAGAAAVAALFFVVRQVWGTRVALVAAFLAAVGSWRVSIDRLAFDTAPTTLCTVLAFYAFLRGAAAVRAGQRGLLPFALAGLAGGLALYGYYPGRFAPVVLALALALLIVQDRGAFVRRAWPGLALCLAVAVVVLLPLARYAIEQPDLFFRRSGQVFLLAPQYLDGQTRLEAVERNLVKHLVMFNWRGEPNARHHAPGWPMLDAVTALCFTVGLAVAVVGALGGRFGARFMLIWLGVMLAPSIVSVDAPSAVRAQDAAPAAYALAALGFGVLWRLLTSAGAPASLRRALPALAGATLALAATLNLWLYFVRLPGDPRVLDKFYVGEARAGYAIAGAYRRDPTLAVYVPRPYLTDETLRFASGRAPLRELPPEAAALPPGPALIVVPNGEDFTRQLAVAQQVARAAGLRQVAGPPPPGGDTPSYIAFVR